MQFVSIVLRLQSGYFVNPLRNDIFASVNKAIIIGSDNGLSTKSYQAIIWTNDGLLLIRISLKI